MEGGVPAWPRAGVNPSARFGMEVGTKGMGTGAALADHADRPPHPGRRRVSAQPSARPMDRRHKRVIQHRLQLTGAANEVGHMLNL